MAEIGDDFTPPEAEGDDLAIRYVRAVSDLAVQPDGNGRESRLQYGTYFVEPVGPILVDTLRANIGCSKVVRRTQYSELYHLDLSYGDKQQLSVLYEKGNFKVDGHYELPGETDNRDHVAQLLDWLPGGHLVPHNRTRAMLLSLPQLRTNVAHAALEAINDFGKGESAMALNAPNQMYRSMVVHANPAEIQIDFVEPRYLQTLEGTSAPMPPQCLQLFIPLDESLAAWLKSSKAKHAEVESYEFDGNEMVYRKRSAGERSVYRAMQRALHTLIARDLVDIVPVEIAYL